MRDLSISIVLYNNDPAELERTIRCCLSIKTDFKLYIIDNSQNDQLRKLCTDTRIDYVYSKSNLGFGAGHNKVMNKFESLGRYHLVLNPDIYYEEGVIEKLLCFLDSNTDIGLLMPKVLYPDGQIQYLCKLLPTPLNWISRFLIPVKKLNDRLNNRFELRFTGYNKIMDVPYISGCFMLIRSSVIKKVGEFDEGIFMYGEDTDLSRRIHKYYRTIFYPDVNIYHKFHKDSRHNLRLKIIHVRAAIYYFNKWGWFFDSERRRINNSILQNVGYYVKG
jgi:GT2 family glycosyltransferase